MRWRRRWAWVCVKMMGREEEMEEEREGRKEEGREGGREAMTIRNDDVCAVVHQLDASDGEIDR